MTFEEAIRKSIKSYYEGKMPEAFMKESGPQKYTPEFFDEMEDKIVSGKDSKKKKKKEEPEDEELQSGFVEEPMDEVEA